MNVFDSATMLAQVGAATDTGFLALAIVQGLGVVLAIGLTFCIQDAHTCKIPDTWLTTMKFSVCAVFVLTVLVAACQKDLAPSLWVDIGGTLPGPQFLYWLDLDAAHLIYFLADFAVLAFLIYATGGPQQSLYATFLFVIVPISIALGKPGVGTVVVFAGITLFIFLSLLWLKPPKYFAACDDENRARELGLGTPSEIGKRARKLWLGAVTTACVVFPTLVFWVQNWAPNKAPGAALTSSKLVEQIVTPGDHDRDLEAGIIQ